MDTGHKAVPLRGKLEAHPVPGIIHALHVQAKTGLLKISAASQRKAIFFAKGDPASSRSSVESESLGHYLLERHLISAEMLERAKASARDSARDESAVLLEVGAIAPNALFESLQGCQRLQMLSAFALTGGDYAFDELPALPPGMVPIRQPAGRLIIDGIAAHCPAERMGRLLELPQTAGLFLRNDAPYRTEELGFSREERAIYNLAASGMSIVSICEQAPARRQALALLFALECMEVLGVTDNPPRVSRGPRDPLADAQYRVRVTAPPPRPPSTFPPPRPLSTVPPPRPPSTFPPPSAPSVPPRRSSSTSPPRSGPVSEPPRRASLAPGAQPKGARSTQPQIDANQPGGESFRMGLHYLGIREYVLASKAFKEALDVARDEPVFSVYFGWTLFLLSPEENTPEAVGAIRSALAKQPKLAVGYYFLGRIHSVLEEHDKAIKAFEAALECDPGYHEADHELEKCRDRKTRPPDKPPNRPSFTDRLTGWTRKK